MDPNIDLTTMLGSDALGESTPTLEPDESAQLLSLCQDWIRRIKKDKDILDDDMKTAMKYFESDPSIVKVIEGRSEVTTTDMFDAVETVKAFLLEIFAGGDQVCKIDPEGEEDVKPAANQELLINKQLRSKNNWFIVCHDVLDEVLRFKFGGIKYRWKTIDTVIEKEYLNLDPMQFQAKSVEWMQSGQQVLNDQPIPMGDPQLDPMTGQMMPPPMNHNVTVAIPVHDEYAEVMAVPSEELFFPIKARDMKSVPFLAHRRSFQKWDFIAEFGQQAWDLVKEVQDTMQSATDESDVTAERFRDLGGLNFVYDKESDGVFVWECYLTHPTTGKAWIYTFAGEIELRSEQNKNIYPPFELGTAFKMAHRLIGKGYFDILKNIMRLRTALLRQFYDNAYQANFRRYFGDPTRVNLKDYLNNNSTNAFIRTMGDPQTAVMPEQKAPLPPEAFQLYELLNVEKDYHSKVPRSFQGVNQNVLNKTFRGQAQQVSQASQGLQMIARLLAEMLFKPLISDIIDLNIRYLQQKMQIRYLNQPVEINPDNIVGKFDITVSVGLGNASKDDMIAKLQQLIGLQTQAMAGGAAFVNQQNMFNSYAELIKAMDLKNIHDFVTDPNLKGVFTQFVATLIQFVLSMGLQSPAQLPPQLVQPLGQVCQILGIDLMALIQGVIGQMQGPPPPGSAKTFPGQNTPAQPSQPTEPMGARTTPGGGGFFG